MINPSRSNIQIETRRLHVGSHVAESEQGDVMDDKVWIAYTVLRKKKQPQV